jgi:hypothetical protein
MYKNKQKVSSVRVNKREVKSGSDPPTLLQAAYWKHPTTYWKDHT